MIQCRSSVIRVTKDPSVTRVGEPRFTTSLPQRIRPRPADRFTIRQRTDLLRQWRMPRSTGYATMYIDKGQRPVLHCAWSLRIQERALPQYVAVVIRWTSWYMVA